MSPKDHKHPEWERKWRDTMTDHQSAPATEEDWLSMSALLEGGAAAPPETPPQAGPAGGTTWNFLPWLLPVVVTVSLATAYWLYPREATPTIGEELAADRWATEDAEDGTLLLSDEASGRQQAPQAVSDDRGQSAGGSRQRSGMNPASGARATASSGPSPDAPPETQRTSPQDAAGKTPPPRETRPAENRKAGGEAEGETVPRAANGPPEPTPPERVSRPRRRIPRWMPQIARDFDPDAIWKRKIERQIAKLRVEPQRQPKADNGLYPRVRVRY
ncbi:hypothetical protein [Lewinella sp. W8]|uniref:hypothetical protein n=1 Tax=Lewinella sp. W8 TaxID=2528208 RepID=UPI001068A49B|nr:hypothetical protein [Lewinella sp. W8]MTB51652.1 hypothetical protein [Lewinella sp. W8]